MVYVDAYCLHTLHMSEVVEIYSSFLLPRFRGIDLKEPILPNIQCKLPRKGWSKSIANLS